MDIIFDIDGTLANAEHRLPHILDNMLWVGIPPRPNWDAFLDPAAIAEDTPILEMWDVLTALVEQRHQIIFVTGRKQSLFDTTFAWLMNDSCPVRRRAVAIWREGGAPEPRLFMRSESDRSKSFVVKSEILHKLRHLGFNPKIAFDDRADDIKMYRGAGLIGCQVSDGQF